MTGGLATLAPTATSGPKPSGWRVARWAPALWPALTAGPALGATGWFLVVLPLLLLDWFRPVPALLLGVPAGVALAVAGVRGWRPSPLPGPAWPLAATVAVAASFTVLSVATAAEHVVLRRDPGTYALTGHWLAEHGALPIPASLAPFGGPDPALTLDSPGFYAVNGTENGMVVPQFMSGLPLTLAVGYWIAGWSGLFAVPAVTGGLALLAMGGLTARLVGPRWAPLGAAVLGISQPVLHAARSAYSEPLNQLLLLGGLCLLLRALDIRSQRLALLAGLVLGAATFVRVDALREVALLVPVAGWLALRRRAEWRPLALGLLGGTAYGAVDAIIVTRPYILTLRASLLPVLALLAVAVGASAGLVAAARRAPRLALGWNPARLRGLPELGATAVVAAAALFAARPWLHVGWIDPSQPSARNVAGMQRALGLPVDGSRSYYEQSLHWVTWYVGWPLIALAVGAAAYLVWATLRGNQPERGWGPVLSVALGSTLLTLLRPAITPDHPWADRRFVPIVLPGLVLLAAWAVAALARAGARRLGPAASWSVTAAGCLALALPAAGATAPLKTAATERGELAAVRQVCRAFQPGEVALLLDARAQNEWMQPLRSICGVPVAIVREPVPGLSAADTGPPPSGTSVRSTREPSPDTLGRIATRIRAAGLRPVGVTARSRHPLDVAGAEVIEQVARLDTQEDAHELVRRPDRTAHLDVDLWIARL
jgi:hypothetical protein